LSFFSLALRVTAAESTYDSICLRSKMTDITMTSPRGRVMITVDRVETQGSACG
jgi:hypothetical protein